MLAVIAALAAVGCADPAEADDPIRAGRTVYGDSCSACHGARGQGGVGPSLEEVVIDFPACSDQQKWIRLGSDRWLTEVGATYGATGKPVNGGMPAHDRLGDDQIATVALYERVEFGGEDKARAFADCGFTGTGDGAVPGSDS